MLEGEQTREPAYNLPATWIEPSSADEAKHSGYTIVGPETLLITHFQELVNRQGYQLLTRAATESLVENAKPDAGGLIEELVPNVLTYSDVQGILQALLKEGVSIRNLVAILECLADAARNNKDRYELTERVRERLRGQIAEQHMVGESELRVITLDADLESRLLRVIKPSEGGPVLVPEPALLDKLIMGITGSCERAMSKGISPTVVCSPRLRLPLKHFCERFVPTLAVLSANELAPGTPLTTIDVLKTT